MFKSGLLKAPFTWHKQAMKILLGGVPFGRNNAGDEAILECIIEMIREIRPDALITVSTDDPETTAERLGVAAVQLFGFEPPFSRTLMEEHLAAADVFIWAGATGLSDYPEIPLSMLEIAHRAGTRTVVWGVGMNTELNPFIYRLQPGKKRRLLQWCSFLTLRRIDFIDRYEQQLKARTCAKMIKQLNASDLVVLRDPETLAAVQACGDVPDAVIGADPAEMLTPAAWDSLRLSRLERSLLESGERKVGLCISAQRRLVHQEELIGFLDRLTESRHIIVFLPMNHLTDAELMNNLRERMVHRDRSVVIEGRREPGEVLAIAGRLDLVISSRLHLLILASLVHVPIIGISRGSKVDNFLAPFGHLSAGSVDQCDFDHMQRELDRLIDSREEFMQVSAAVHDMLLERLDYAKGRLADVLQ
jgi:polysaccharide pyruvyl transferase WcaK-like protein